MLTMPHDLGQSLQCAKIRSDGQIHLHRKL